jgi:hypothetical protein
MVLLLADLIRAWRRGLSGRLSVLAVALALVVGYGLAMSLSAKQGDRYLVPIFPMLDILSALVLGTLLGWIGQKWRPLASSWAKLGAAVALVLLVALWWLPLAPYYGAYFNPLLGDGATAVWAFPFGQGEGLDQAAAYLNEKENAENLLVASFYPEEFQTYFRGTVISLRQKEWSKTWLYSDYVVFYVSQVQRELPDAELVSFFRSQEPEYTARIGGVDFAWIYKPPLLLGGASPAASGQVDVLFGDQIALDGFSVGTAALTPGSPWDLTLHWQARQVPQANYGVTARLTGPNGDVVWQSQWSPFEDRYPTTWWPVGRIVYDRQTLMAPELLVPGETYCLEIRLYNPEGGAPLLPADDARGDWLQVLCLPAQAP